LKGGNSVSLVLINNEGVNAACTPFTDDSQEYHWSSYPTPYTYNHTAKESCEVSELKEELSRLKRRVGYVLLCRSVFSRVEGIVGWSTIDNERVEGYYLPNYALLGYDYLP